MPRQSTLVHVPPGGLAPLLFLLAVRIVLYLRNRLRVLWSHD